MLDDSVQLAAKSCAIGMETAGHGDETQDEKIEPVKVLKEHLKVGHVEAAVLERSGATAGKFRMLDEREIRAALKDS